MRTRSSARRGALQAACSPPAAATKRCGCGSTCQVGGAPGQAAGAVSGCCACRTSAARAAPPERAGRRGPKAWRLLACAACPALVARRQRPPDQGRPAPRPRPYCMLPVAARGAAGNEFECLDVKPAHAGDVKMVAWHPGGELLASCSYDDTIKLWACLGGDEWECAQTLEGGRPLQLLLQLLLASLEAMWGGGRRAWCAGGGSARSWSVDVLPAAFPCSCRAAPTHRHTSPYPTPQPDRSRRSHVHGVVRRLQPRRPPDGVLLGRPHSQGVALRVRGHAARVHARGDNRRVPRAHHLQLRVVGGRPACHWWVRTAGRRFWVGGWWVALAMVGPAAAGWAVWGCW